MSANLGCLFRQIYISGDCLLKCTQYVRDCTSHPMYGTPVRHSSFVQRVVRRLLSLFPGLGRWPTAERYRRETPAVNRRRGRLSSAPDLRRIAAASLAYVAPNKPIGGSASTGIVIDGCINNGCREHDAVHQTDAGGGADDYARYCGYTLLKLAGTNKLQLSTI